MIFMFADGAVYIQHQWLLHEAALTCNVDPTTRCCLCEFRVNHHATGRSMGVAWANSGKRFLEYAFDGSQT